MDTLIKCQIISLVIKKNLATNIIEKKRPFKHVSGFGNLTKPNQKNRSARRDSGGFKQGFSSVSSRDGRTADSRD